MLYGECTSGWIGLPWVETNRGSGSSVTTNTRALANLPILDDGSSQINLWRINLYPDAPRSGSLTIDHPGNAEAVYYHTKALRPERFFDWVHDATTIGELLEKSFSVTRASDIE